MVLFETDNRRSHSRCEFIVDDRADVVAQIEEARLGSGDTAVIDTIHWVQIGYRQVPLKILQNELSGLGAHGNRVLEASVGACRLVCAHETTIDEELVDCMRDW